MFFFVVVSEVKSTLNLSHKEKFDQDELSLNKPQVSDRNLKYSLVINTQNYLCGALRHHFFCRQSLKIGTMCCVTGPYL